MLDFIAPAVFFPRDVKRASVVAVVYANSYVHKHLALNNSHPSRYVFDLLSLTLCALLLRVESCETNEMNIKVLEILTASYMI